MKGRSMQTRTRVIGGICALAVLICTIGSAGAGAAKPAYLTMAPLGQYLMASPADEVALARSAAPASIAGDADLLTLGSHGYETAAKGKNGFVCMVWRSWTAGFEDAEFWNPKIRAPICLNGAAARTVLPGYLERTKWVLAGISRTEMIARTKTAVAANRFLPAPGAMSFMMSKQGYLGDAAGGHWHPHLMFFVDRTDGAAWGADLRDSPVSSAQDDHDPITTFFVLVAKWSDGTPAETR
jgi:hypothetical protein